MLGLRCGFGLAAATPMEKLYAQRLRNQLHDCRQPKKRDVVPWIGNNPVAFRFPHTVPHSLEDETSSPAKISCQFRFYDFCFERAHHAILRASELLAFVNESSPCQCLRRIAFGNVERRTRHLAIFEAKVVTERVGFKLIAMSHAAPFPHQSSARFASAY